MLHLLLLILLILLALELVLLHPLELVPVDVAAMFDFLVDEMMKILGLVASAAFFLEFLPPLPVVDFYMLVILDV